MLKIYNISSDFKTIINSIQSFNDEIYEFYSNNNSCEPICYVKINRKKSKLMVLLSDEQMIQNFLERIFIYIENEMNVLFSDFNNVTIKTTSPVKKEETLIKFYSDGISDKGKLTVNLTSMNYNFETFFELLQRYDNFPISVKYVNINSINKDIKYFITYKRNENNKFYVQSLLYEDKNFRIDYTDNEDVTFIKNKALSKGFETFDIEIFDMLKASEILSDIDIDENAFINKFEYNLSKVYPKIFIKNLPHNISEWNEEHYKIAENICYEIDDN